MDIGRPIIQADPKGGGDPNRKTVLEVRSVSPAGYRAAQRFFGPDPEVDSFTEDHALEVMLDPNLIVFRVNEGGDRQRVQAPPHKPGELVRGTTRDGRTVIHAAPSGMQIEHAPAAPRTGDIGGTQSAPSSLGAAGTSSMTRST